MSKTRKWHTKAIYTLVALVMTLGLLMVPATPVAADIPVPEDAAGTPINASFDISGGVFTARADGTIVGSFTAGPEQIVLPGPFLATGDATIGGVAYTFGMEAKVKSTNFIVFDGDVAAEDLSTLPTGIGMPVTGGSISIGTDGAFSCSFGFTLEDGTASSAVLSGYAADASLVPDLGLDVKSGVQRFDLYNGEPFAAAGYPIEWSILPGINLTAQDIDVVAGGEDGDLFIEVRAMVPGDCHVVATINGVLELDAEKKWGEISRTELGGEATTTGNYLIEETVYAKYVWGPGGELMEKPAGDAQVNWWLMDIAVLDDPAFEVSPFASGEWCDFWPTAEVTEDPFVTLEAFQVAYPVNLADSYFIANGDDYIKTYTVSPDGTSAVAVSAASPSGVAVIVLAEYPLDYHGENREAVEFTTLPGVVGIAEVKTPQLRWAGEKIVLEKNWGGLSPYFEITSGNVTSGNFTANATLYAADYNQEGTTIGNLEPIAPSPQLTITDDSGEITVDACALIGCDIDRDHVTAPLDMFGISRCILLSEQEGEVDVNAALYQWSGTLTFENGVLTDSSLSREDNIENYGFLVYYLEFEEVVLAEEITSAGSLAGGAPIDPHYVAVQVKGFLDYNHANLPARVRDEKPIDITGDGEPDIILPQGRWVFPDDWRLLAGGYYELRPNFDLMDAANNDEITSLAELGPYDEAVATPEIVGEAEYPCIGPFNTLQQWSTEDMWIATASVPTSMTDALGRCTVVPDGEIDAYDAPMPQALVLFKVKSWDKGICHSFSELDKGDLEGYGVVGDLYQSPFYAAEIPSSEFIPSSGYNWDSWAFTEPYDYWTDLMLDSIICNTTEVPVDDQDVEVYCDNHGIAGVTVDPLCGGGTVEIVAIADYPNSLLRGKYGPRVSPPIYIGAIPDLNPHFVVPKYEVGIAEELPFDPSSTVGGTEPYILVEWDWEGDDSYDLFISIGDAQAAGIDLEDTDAVQEFMLQTIYHAYDEAGTYRPIIRVTDSSTPPLVRAEQLITPIVVAGGGLPPGPDNPTVEDGLESIADELVLAYCFKAGEGVGGWTVYNPDWPAAENTLETLYVGRGYWINVSEACTLTYGSHSYELDAGWNMPGWLGY